MDFEYNDFSTKAICERMLMRNSDVIRVQKAEIALPKLERIVEATLGLSRKKGFYATTLRELSTECSISMGGLYTYFESKNSLLHAILNEVSSTIRDILCNPPAGVSESPTRHLVWLIRTHIEVTDQMARWFAFTYMEARFFPEEERRVVLDGESATEDLFANVLERGRQSGEFQIEDPVLTAALIKSLLQDWYVKHSKYRRRDITANVYADTVVSLIAHAVACNATLTDM